MLISICREPVKALATRTGETAHLAVREGREVFFIDHHASGDQGVIVPGQTGKLMPLHCTAHGKALLADFGLAELKALFGTTPLERYTARTSVSLPDLAKACAQVRADGYSMDDARVPGRRPLRGRADPRSGRPRDRLNRRLRARHPHDPTGATPCWLSTSATPPDTSTRCSERAMLTIPFVWRKFFVDNAQTKLT